MIALAAAVLAQSALPPAFWDAPDAVTVWTPQPLTALQAREARVIHPGGEAGIASAEAIGRPWREGMDDPDPNRMVIVGSLQAQLGDGDWNPGGVGSRMKAAGPDRWELAVRLAPGRYEYKAAQGGTWERNWGLDFQPGGANIPLTVPEGSAGVRFVVDLGAGFIGDSINNPARVPSPQPGEAEDRTPQASELFQAFRLRLAEPLPASLVKAGLTLRGIGEDRPIRPRGVLDQPAFRYAKSDLGARWSPKGTWFKAWSPAARSAWVRLDRLIPMRQGSAGVWYAYVSGDLHGREYTFRFDHQGRITEGADIHSFAANEPLTKSVVVDLERTDPEGWTAAPRVRRGSQADAVIYEAHVRDFTIQPAWGGPERLRGSYLGAARTGTRSPQGLRTGLDHLAWLGATDLHLLPIQSFQFGGYSWGYGTTLFNVPEAQYSTRPQDPMAPIREVKQMVAGLHRAGIRVVLDVVYNHTWPPEGPGSAFEAAVPHFYLREDERGRKLNESGVGNALADERFMARQFVQDSLSYWLDEYGVDGFRFDLMGMHRPESVRSWVRAIRAKRPDAVIYGEPWTGGGPTYFPKGAQQGMNAAVFNDDFRSLWRGDTDGSGAGAMHGAPRRGEDLVRALSGSPVRLGGWTLDPVETINYVSAHDNLSLWDKTARAMPGASRADQERAVRLGTAAVLLSAGVPFLEGGVEIGRTKGGNHNSYDAGDAVNQFDWQRAAGFQELAEYTRGLIAIRRAHPALRPATRARAEAAAKAWASLTDSAAWMEIDGSAAGDSWRRILIVFNAGRIPLRHDFGAGWNLASDGVRAVDGSLRRIAGLHEVPPMTAWALWQ